MYQWDKLSKDYTLGNYSKEYIQIPGLLRYVKFEQNYNLLDAGCGSGSIAKIFYDKGLFVTGIDNSKQMISLAKKFYSGPSYFVKDITKYSAKCRFDVIISNMVLCNLSSTLQVRSFFKQCFTNLKAGCYLYVTNRSPKFQKTCSFGFDEVIYPKKIYDGCVFRVRLSSLKSTTIGPFNNYHWGKNFILDTSRSVGFKFSGISPLLSSNMLDLNPDKAKYCIYSFKK